jgi:hypothetical protein
MFVVTRGEYFGVGALLLTAATLGLIPPTGSIAFQPQNTAEEANTA